MFKLNYRQLGDSRGLSESGTSSYWTFLFDTKAVPPILEDSDTQGHRDHSKYGIQCGTRE